MGDERALPLSCQISRVRPAPPKSPSKGLRALPQARHTEPKVRVAQLQAEIYFCQNTVCSAHHACMACLKARHLASHLLLRAECM